MKKLITTKLLGNVLITMSLGILLSIYFPFIVFYFQNHQVSAEMPAKGFVIYIPKINAKSPVTEHVDAWNKEIYEKALKNGVAHAQGTYLPRDKKTVFLFAHSSANPWELTRYNTVFMFLGNLQEKDDIFLFHNGEKYHYKVTAKKNVWPSDTSFLQELEKNQLVLQTCTPLGTDFQRLLVFAKPV